MATTATVQLKIREGSAYRRLITASANGKKYAVKVGFVGTAGEARHGESGITNAHLAAVLEFGYAEGNIPPRPAFAPSFDLHLPEYQAFCRRIAEGVTAGKVTVEQGLGLLGAKMAADLKDFITGGAPISPENAPSVKRRKERKSSGSPWGVRTWVDTGALVNSITWVVEEVP